MKHLFYQSVIICVNIGEGEINPFDYHWDGMDVNKGCKRHSGL